MVCAVPERIPPWDRLSPEVKTLLDRNGYDIISALSGQEVETSTDCPVLNMIFDDIYTKWRDGKSDGFREAAEWIMMNMVTPEYQNLRRDLDGLRGLRRYKSGRTKR